MTPYQAGELTGQLGLSALLLAGVVKSLSIAQRPTTNTYAAAGLAAALGAWTTASIVTALRLYFPPSARDPLLGFVGLALFGLGSAAVVLAIVGLTQLGRRRYEIQGRAQAIWAIVLGGLVFVAMTAGFVTAALDGERKQQVASEGAIDWGTKGEVLRFDDLNFTIEAPPSPYVRWDAKKTNPSATVAFLRTKPYVYAIVIAERNESGSVMDSAGLAAIARANVQANSKATATVTADEPHAVNGLPGMRFFADTKAGALDITYAFWTYADNGFLYQIMVWGEPRDRTRVRADAEAIVARFHVIDRTRPAKEPARPFGRFQSAEFPYSVDLEGSPWMLWPASSRQHKEAEIGGLLGNQSAFAITPFVLDGRPVHPDALTSSVLREWGVEFPGAVTGLRKLDYEGLSGYELGFSRQSDNGPYDYRVRVLSKDRWGVFAIAWTAHKTGDEIAGVADGVFRGLHIDTRTPPLDPATLGENGLRYHARLYDHLGLFYYRAKDYRTSLGYLEPAVRWDDRESDYLLHAVRAWADAGEPASGLTLLDRSTAHKDDPEVRSWRAWLLAKVDRKPEALSAYDALFKGGYRGDDDFLEYARLLADAQRWDDLEKAFASYLQKEDSLKLRLEQSRILARAKRYADGARILEDEQKKMTFSTDLSWALITHYNGLEQYRKVVDLCDQMIAHGFDSAEVRYAKGDAEVGLKWYRAAKLSLELALKKKPGDTETKDYLKYVSGLLGEGENTSVKAEIVPVTLPEALAPQLAAAEKKGDAPGYGAHYVYIVDGFRYEKGKATTRTTRQRVKVTDASGLERFSTIEIPFDPLAEQVFVNELTVRDESGAVVARGNVKDYYVTDHNTDQASHRQVLYVPVPSLAIGHSFDLVVTRRDRAPASTFGYESFSLSGLRPMRVRAVYCLGDPAALRYEAPPTVKTEHLADGLLWTLEDTPVYPAEPLQATRSRFAPTLRLASAGAEWPTLARQYMAEIEPKLAADPQVKALAQRLTQGASTRDEKVQALVRHVQSSYVYKAIEFGRRARIPNTAGETVRRKYGDCKDHSVLLRQLLEASGISAHLTLINLYDDVHKDLPSLDQFDHMVVFVPGEGGAPGVFYDGTDKSASAALNPPLGLAGRDGLVLDPAGPHFESVAAYATESSRVNVERRMRVAADGSATVAESVSLAGYYASFLRSHLKTQDPSKHKEWAQEALASVLHGARLASFTAHDVKDNDKPLTLEMEYALPGLCTNEAGGWRCAPAVSWERHYLALDAVTGRRSPFAIEYPLHVTSRTETSGPAGWKLDSTVKEGTRGEEACSDWRATVAVAGDSVTTTFDGRLKRGEFPADRYGPCEALIERGLRASAPALRLERRDSAQVAR
jgi:transglutaminase-like putative cysteine protease